MDLRAGDRLAAPVLRVVGGDARPLHRLQTDELDRLASLVEDRAEVDGLRGALELVAYAIEGLAVAVGHITPDGARAR